MIMMTVTAIKSCRCSKRPRESRAGRLCGASEGLLVFDLAHIAFEARDSTNFFVLQEIDVEKSADEKDTCWHRTALRFL